MINRLRTPDGGERTLGGVATQVLRRCADGQWRFISFQMTPNGDEVWPRLPSELAGHPVAKSVRANPEENEKP